MKIFITLVFVVIATLDVLIIGMSYGAKEVQIKVRYHLLISTIAGIGTYFAMLFGNVIGNFFSASIGNIIGGSILLLLGSKLLLDCIKSKQQIKTFFEQIKSDPQAIDVNHSGKIEPFEMLILAVFLALNNMGLGISAHFAELSIVVVSLLSILCSLTFLSAGYLVGRHLKHSHISKNIDLVCAVVMIALGMYTLFT